MRPNRLREMWAAGKKANNCFLAIPSSISAETIAHQGWDSVTIDMQHAAVDSAAAYQMLVAVSTSDTVPLVRVPWNEPGTIMRMLDYGAYGVMCPTIDTVEDCVRFVGAVRYAPDGYRSVGPFRAALYAGRDYLAKANETVLAIAQIETKPGLDNVEAIAKVPGIDMLYIGPSDLGLALGRTAAPDQTDPVVVDAIDRILAAAHAAGIRAGIYCASVDYGRKMVEKGFDLVTVCNDRQLLAQGGVIREKMA